MDDDPDGAPIEPVFPRLQSEQTTRVTRDWSIPMWAGTSDKLVAAQRLAEDCLERAWKDEVEHIKETKEPGYREDYINEASSEYGLHVEVKASGGRITKTGELSTIFGDTDLRDVESIKMASSEWADRGAVEVRLDRGKGASLSVVGPDLQWVYGTIEALSAQLVKDRPWWWFVRRGWFTALVAFLTSAGLASIVVDAMNLKNEAGEPTSAASQFVLGALLALVSTVFLALLVFVPVFNYAFPAFEVIERGGQSTGRKVLGGLVTFLGFGLGVAGLVLVHGIMAL